MSDERRLPFPPRGGWESSEQAAAEARVRPPVPTPAAAAANARPVEEPVNRDLPAQLRDLAELHAGGALTDDEFQQAKRKLLE